MYYYLEHNKSLKHNISLSFCAFLYNGVCFNGLKLSISDVIDSQKLSNGDGKLQFFGRDYNLYVLDMQEKSVKDKKFLLALQNFAQNEQEWD